MVAVKKRVKQAKVTENQQQPKKKQGFSFFKKKAKGGSNVVTQKLKKKQGFSFFKKKAKKSKTADTVADFNKELNLSNNSKFKKDALGNFQIDKAALVRNQLKGAAKLIGDTELDQLVEMNTKVNVIQKRMNMRFILTVMFVVVGLISGLFFKKYIGLTVTAGLAIGSLTWYQDIKKTTTYYKNYRFQRQIAFSQFVRLAAAYLPALAHGTNLYSIFKKILPRMNNERDHASLETLMINMQLDPANPAPFLKFAESFSVSDSAEMIMATIHQMYLGDVDDRGIRALADIANEDMLRQIDNVIHYKINKFNNLTTKVTMITPLIVLGYTGIMLADSASNIFTLLSQNGGILGGKK